MKHSKLARFSHRRDLIVEPLESRITPGSVSFPNVISIDRQAPAGPETGVSSVVFRVTFDQIVLNVDEADFDVVTTGNAKADAAVTVASVSGSIYDVTVSGVQGNGDLQLNLVDNGSIFNSSEGQLGGAGPSNGSFTGEIYQVLQTHPTVNSIVAVAPNPTAATSVSWTVTFSELVTGVDVSDFVTVPVGLTAPNAPTVTPINPVGGAAMSYTVTVSGLIGTGTIGLNLADDETIRDVDDNPLRTSPIDLAEPVTVGETGSGPVAVVSGDIDGDGIADLAIANRFSNTVSIALGNGDGTFQSTTTVATDNQPRSLALADVNGDGRPDLIVAASSYTSGSGFNTVNVLLGNGDGTFMAPQKFGSGFSPRAVAVADLNGDGNPDIAVTDYASPNYRVQVLLGNGNGTFQAPQNFTTGRGANSIAIGDVNGDGIADVVTGNEDDGNVSVLLGTGTGSLGAHTTFGLGLGGRISPTGVAIGDLDGDGRPDLAVSGHYYYYDEGNEAYYNDGTVTVLLGDGDGTFGSPDTTFVGQYLSAVALTDMDGDGRRDILVTNAPSIDAVPQEGPSQTLAPGAEVFILRNNGDGFDEAIGFGTFGVSLDGLAIADFDGDGKADVSVVGDFNYAAVLLNEGTGNFTGEVFDVVAPFLDLAITSFSDGVSSAQPGDVLTFTINYQNLGTTGATGVTITVPLSANLNFVAADNTGWTQDGNTLERVIAGTVGAGATGTETLQLRVNSTITAFASSIGVTATISDDGTQGEDSNSENNSQSDFDALTGLTTDLTITTIEDPRLAVPGGQINFFTVHFSNIGNRDSSGASITVTLPANSSFFSFASDARWTTGSGTIMVTDLDVPAGGADQTISYAIGVFPSPGDTAPLTTIATIDGKPDDNSENNSATEETPVYHGFVVTSPGVAIKKKFAPPILRVFDKLTGEELFTITAYEEPYRDSIRVALGDFNFDGIDDIVTTTMGGNGRLRIFDGATGEQLIEEFAVFDGRRDRGAFVAVGNIVDFGRPEIVVGSALGGGKVRVYSFDNFDKSDDSQPEQGDSLPTLELIKQYTPFGAGFRGGVRVAVGDVDGFPDQKPATLPEGGRTQFVEDDIIVGQGFFGARVKVFKGATDTVLGEFKVGGRGFRGGVSVGAADIDGDGHADIIVGRNTGRPSVVEVFDGESILDGGTATALGPTITPFGSTFRFGVRVAAADVNGDGVADIIASGGIKNSSIVKFYDGADYLEGTVTEITDRQVTAYSEFPNVALWVAASRSFTSVF